MSAVGRSSRLYVNQRRKVSLSGNKGIFPDFCFSKQSGWFVDASQLRTCGQGSLFEICCCLLFSKNIATLPEKRQYICCWILEEGGTQRYCPQRCLSSRKGKNVMVLHPLPWACRVSPAGLLLISSKGKQGRSLTENLYQKCVSRVFSTNSLDFCSSDYENTLN